MLTITTPLHQKEFNNADEPVTEKGIALFLKEHIFDQASLLKASIWLGVTPAALRKILSGRPPSRYLFKKLSRGIQQGNSPDEVLFQTQKVQRLLNVYRLYQEKGTLASAGKEMGLTRERVRQLLQKGAELGLFEYKKPPGSILLSIPKERIIEDYKNLLQFSQVAKSNGISMHQFYQLLQYYQIPCKELEAIRMEGHQLKSILQYYTHVRKLGFHPSTTELQKTNEGRCLSWKITKLWGSIHAFREELNIHFSVR
ncbi:MAG: hypothetical protein ACYDBV_07990 [Nitrospiria bacterium]